ncbi:MAG TPA: ATP-binding protein [Candidatus Deferrimicrobium sp.]|nr:ATP-binding protein [Candidatus Kapabacteria bacterium]HLP61476.1 ATP-binding protein [Candidatus Deferrimicrobium sp.]
MKEIINTILLEWQDRALPETKERDITLDNYLNTGHAIVVKGFRRVGKTFLFYNLIKKLLKDHSKKEVIYFNFEDERIPLKTEFLTMLLPAIKEFHGQSPQYFFLDEIQVIPGWSRWLRRILDTENIKIFITGSSSKMSEREIPTELRGRYLGIELLPLSFKEFLDFKNIPAPPGAFKNIDKKTFLNYLTEYLEEGGMPAVVLAEKGLKKEIILNYFNTLIRRDIIEKFKIRNEEVLKDLLKLLMNATHFTGTRIFNNLKSLGHIISKTTVRKYISYINDSFFMDELLEFSPKVKNQLQRERKIYFIDNGFIGLANPRLNLKEGRFLENSVYYHLRRRYKNADIYYMRAEKSEEVDFVLIDDMQKKKMIQVSYNLELASTKEREIRALALMGKKLGLNEGDIITFDMEGQEEAGWEEHSIKINIIPAWKFFLE